MNFLVFSSVALLSGCGQGQTSRAKIFPTPDVPPNDFVSTDHCHGDRYLQTVPILIGNDMDFQLELRQPNGENNSVKRYISDSVGELDKEFPKLRGQYVWAFDRTKMCTSATLLLEIVPSGSSNCWMDEVSRYFSGTDFPMLRMARRTREIEISGELDRESILKNSSMDMEKITGNYILITKKNCLNNNVFKSLKTVLFRAKMHASENKN